MIKKPTYNISGDEIKNTSFDDMTESVESSDVRSGFMYVLIMVLHLVIATIISFLTCKTAKV